MLNFDTYRLPENPIDPETGVQMPSLFTFEGDVSLGIHPTTGGVELRIADSDGRHTEAFTGSHVRAYTEAMLKANAVADVARAAEGF